MADARRRDVTRGASIAALSILAAAPAQAASPAVGLWATPEHDGRIAVADCGAGLCGRIVDGPELHARPEFRDAMNADPKLRGRKLLGLEIFDGLQGGPRTWRGRVYNPVDGHSYSGSVTLLAPDRLKLTGCIIFPLCKSQVWKRVG